MLISLLFLQKSFIRSIGGRDGKEHITRSLTKLFNNEYAGKCTMTGRGKNIITKMGDTELIKILTSNFTIYLVT